jgi:periplasmic mercuric ion binding protein
MKSGKIIIAAMTFIAALFLSSTTLQAQEKSKTETVVVKSSVVCAMCEQKVKKDLAFEKGVTDIQVNLKEKLITVEYRPNRTNEEKIKKAITKIGYDADELMADEKAYDKLPACCKRDVEPH